MSSRIVVAVLVLCACGGTLRDHQPGGAAAARLPQPLENGQQGPIRLQGLTDDARFALAAPGGAHMTVTGPVLDVTAGPAFSLQIQVWPDRDLAALRQAMARRLGPRLIRWQSEDGDAFIVQAAAAPDGTGGGFHLEALVADGAQTARCNSDSTGSFLLADVEHMLTACRTITMGSR